MTFYVKTYGCQMNQNDSQIIEVIFRARGMRAVRDIGEADLVVVNTCSVRNHAERRAHGFISALHKWKRSRRERVLCVVGCMSQRHGQDLMGKHPWVDIVAGPDTYQKLPDYVAEVSRGRTKVCDLGLHGELYCGITPDATTGVTAYVSIMRGCDNYCSFCVVPYLRGHARSRPAWDIVEEVEQLVARGVREVMLLGQNVNAYRDGAISFAGLLRCVNEVPGLARIRFLTSHPADMDDTILGAAAELSKVCEFFHLPLQSGSDRVLELMNRRYTSRQYRELVDRARRLMPGLGLSTDVIVGFPTESDDDYQATRAMMQEIGFDAAYMFKYSSHRETASAELEPKVDEATAQERLDGIIALQNSITREKHAGLIGQVGEVLVEGRARDGKWTGRMRDNKIVLFEGNAEAGTLVRVRVERVSGWTPIGKKL